MKKLFITLAVVMLMGMLTACGKTTINLNDYVTITTEGYDTMGTATYEFDSARFEADFEEKIKAKKMNAEIKLQLAMGYSSIEILEDMCIDYERGESQNLSNGDELVLKWTCNDDLAKEYFGCNLKYDDITHTVSGLTEVEIFDPLEYVTVSIDGVSPRAEYTYTVDEEQPLMKHFTVTVDGPAYFVANGDVITVSARLINSIEEDKFLQEYGVYPGGGKKEISVEGLPTFVRTLEELPKDVLEESNAKFAELYREYQDKANEMFGKDSSYVKDFTYLGFCFLVDELNFEAVSNEVLLLYRVTALDPKTQEDVDYYAYGIIESVAEKDGEITFGEVDRMDNAGRYGNSDCIIMGLGNYYFFLGYETMEKLEFCLESISKQYSTSYKYMLEEQ